MTNLSTGPAKYDVSIQKLTIPGVNFTLSCPTGLRVSWTSGQPKAQTQQPVNAQGERSPPDATNQAGTSPSVRHAPAGTGSPKCQEGWG